MRPFLYQTAEHYLQCSGLEDRLFIFPNRRSAIFFRKYLSDAVKALPAGSEYASRPLMEPVMMSINDFFGQATGLVPTDKVSLLLCLYDCYKSLNASAESLDDFIYWGDVLLSDFDDIDKYLVNAEGLFTNISDVKDLQDDFSYLTERQLDAIRKLASHFAPGRWAGPVSGKGRDVKESFIRIWHILYPLYTEFRQTLREQGMAYEGLVYRDLAERLDSESIADVLSAAFPETSGYVFVGLNALNECEKRVLGKMQKAGLAEFCWDFCGDMIRDDKNSSSHFIKENLVSFPQAFEPEGGTHPDINIVSVPSATGQAKILSEFIGKVPEDERTLDFAVVLPDESLLMPVLGGLPVPVINVTMGYPLADSEFYSLMREISAMQMHLRMKDGRAFFYHKQVLSIFSSGLVKGMMDEAEKERAAAIRKEAKYYIPEEDFGGSPLFRLLFRPVTGDLTSTDPAQIRSLASYLIEVVTTIAPKLGEENILQIECARKYYCCVNALKDKPLAVLPKTWLHLLDQMASCMSVPFAGEPLGGLQVMGPLETRALDFKHIVVLSANDGVFPRRSASTSFIPPEMRAAFGLPTYEHQDAVWSYYFYRMISRAENVWLVYDSRTEGLNSGEESRYVKQLRYLYGDRCKVSEYVTESTLDNPVTDDEIPKTEEDVNIIRNTQLSASAVEAYIQCPVKFYYHTVKQLYVDEEITDVVEADTLGEVCHDTLEALFCGEKAMSADLNFDKRDKKRRFKPLPEIDEKYLSSWLAREADIRAKVYSLIRHKLRTIEVTGRNLVSAEIAVKYVMKVIERDIMLIRSHGPLKVHGVEEKYHDVDICGFRFGGYIDRLDGFSDGTVRVVDYKTGSDNPEILDPVRQPGFVGKLFSGSEVHKYKAAFQFYCYDRFIKSDERYDGHRLTNSMYAMKDIFIHPVSVYDVSEEFDASVDRELSAVLSEMVDLSKPFKRANGFNTCKYCDYKILCGRSENE